MIAFSVVLGCLISCNIAGFERAPGAIAMFIERHVREHTAEEPEGFRQGRYPVNARLGEGKKKERTCSRRNRQIQHCC
jgi:hypothetical protein